MPLDKRLIKIIDENIVNAGVFTKFIAPVLVLAPFDKIKKNILLNKLEASRGELILRSYPYKGILNITDVCNLRCTFCEIHYIYEKFEKKYPNFIDTDIINKYGSWLKYLYNLEFYGATGEPLLNKDFANIIKFIKTEYHTRLFLNTNGILLNQTVADTMIKYGFDDVLISFHAGSEEVYGKLVGDNFGQLLRNVEYLLKRKKEFRKTKPLVGLAFALNKINSIDIEKFINLAAELGVDYIAVNHYYDVRNKLDKDVSFYFDPEEGNRILNRMYELGRAKGINLFPKKQPYLPASAELNNIIKNNEIKKRKCYAPWTNIKFEGCIEHKDSHYITVCNRIVLFRINYKEYDMESKFDLVWNHPVLQYMRKTVNSNEPNPICAFCKNFSTAAIRCIDNERYRELRDKATQDFFQQVKKNYNMPEIDGLYLLDETPYQ